MARIQPRKGKRGTSYQATVRLKGYGSFQGKKSISATFPTRGEAKSWAVDIERQIRARRFRDPGLADITLEEALERYLATITIWKAHTTQERERRSARRLVEGFGAQTLLPDITPRVVASYRDERLRSVSAYSVRLEFALLSHLFRKAIQEWELPLENPVDKIDRPKAPGGRKVFLQPEEIQKLLEQCSNSRNRMLYPYILTMLHSAMRPGETALC